jgi:hypothetical protein
VTVTKLGCRCILQLAGAKHKPQLTSASLMDPEWKPMARQHAKRYRRRDSTRKRIPLS